MNKYLRLLIGLVFFTCVVLIWNWCQNCPAGFIFIFSEALIFVEYNKHEKNIGVSAFIMYWFIAEITHTDMLKQTTLAGSTLAVSIAGLATYKLLTQFIPKFIKE